MIAPWAVFPAAADVRQAVGTEGEDGGTEHHGVLPMGGGGEGRETEEKAHHEGGEGVFFCFFLGL